MKTKYFTLSTCNCKSFAIVKLENDNIEDFNKRVLVAIKEHFCDEYDNFDLPLISDLDIAMGLQSEDCSFEKIAKCYEDTECDESDFYTEEITFVQAELY